MTLGEDQTFMDELERQIFDMTAYLRLLLLISRHKVGLFMLLVLLMMGL